MRAVLALASALALVLPGAAPGALAAPAPAAFVDFASASEACVLLGAAPVPLPCDAEQRGDARAEACPGGECVVHVDIEGAGHGLPGLSQFTLEARWQGAAIPLCDNLAFNAGTNGCIVFVFLVLPLDPGACGVLGFRAAMVSDAALEATTVAELELCRDPSGAPSLRPLA